MRTDAICLRQIRLDSGDQPGIVAVPTWLVLPAVRFSLTAEELHEIAATTLGLHGTGDEELLDRLLTRCPVSVPVQVNDRRQDLRERTRLDRHDVYPVSVGDRDGTVRGPEIDPVRDRCTTLAVPHDPTTTPAASTVADAVGRRLWMLSTSASCSISRLLSRSLFLASCPRRAGRTRLSRSEPVASFSRIHAPCSSIKVASRIRRV